MPLRRKISTLARRFQGHVLSTPEDVPSVVVLSKNDESSDVKKGTKDPITWRVRGVPLAWTRQQLQDFIASNRSITLAVQSLAEEIDCSSQTATIVSQDPQFSGQNDHKQTIKLPGPFDNEDARDQSMTLDDAFLGITTLYRPPSDDHKIDIIAISGLGGHAFGSFKERSGPHMWLRDSLPYDLKSETTNKPMARIMIYGYESSVAGSQSFQNIEDLATGLHTGLLRLISNPTRPIILLAHSLGGLVVKQALLALSKSKTEDDHTLIQAIYGIVFFGVPHHGMDISSLIPMVGDGPNRFLLESIGHASSQVLAMQHREFHPALGDEGHSEVFCFYETCMSPTAEQDENGNWRMKGPPAILVTKPSATHCRHWEDGPEHICAINRTHSDMVKFMLHDDEYDKVRERVRGLARRALTIRDRIRAETKFLVPYNPNPHFIGRDMTLRTLKQQLGLGQPQRSATSSARVALYGLGGIGKTQIALAYTYWLREACPSIATFWVHGSSIERFYESYAFIAKEYSIFGHEDPKVDLLALVKSWLEHSFKTRWLMVIDNADETELFFPPQQEKSALTTGISVPPKGNSLGRYIPECMHGKILITSRNKQAASRLAQGIEPILVDKMDDNEAHWMLCKILKSSKPSEAETFALSSRLECLPLALAQAAAFIQEYSATISEYVELLDESDKAFVDRLSEPFETFGRDSGTPHAVTATWAISFNKIEERIPLAADILSFLSFFHRQAVPKTFVEYYCNNVKSSHGDAVDTATMMKALGTLKAFSFISIDTHRNMDMHRLVQLVTRKWLSTRNTMAELAQQALEIMAMVFPHGKYETSDECLQLLPHAAAVLKNTCCIYNVKPVAKSFLLRHMGAYFSYKGNWNIAEQHHAESVNTLRKELGEDHPDTITSIAYLASTLRDQGRLDEAEKLQMKVMEAHKSNLGENHLETLTIMNNLALTLQYQGRWKEAEKLQMQVVEAQKSKLGGDHPHTLASINTLALTIQAQGRWKEAEKLQMQVVEARKSKLGEDHPHTLTSMNNLASTIRAQGRWKEAEKLQMQVVEARKSKLGEDHPDTLTSMNNLAFTWHVGGKQAEAVALMKLCLSLRERVLGPDHPSTMRSHESLTSWEQEG